MENTYRYNEMIQTPKCQQCKNDLKNDLQKKKTFCDIRCEIKFYHLQHIASVQLINRFDN